MIDLPTPALIGMVHLPALPGTPGHLISVDAIIERALCDAVTLKEAGFDAVMIENFGDCPYVAGALEPASVAVMAVVAQRVRHSVDVVVGINALRNDACAALGIAVAAGASIVRVNVHTGVAATDQGLIEGTAAKTLRYRKLLGVRVAILADVHVKHAIPVGQQDIALAAKDAAYRGLADGLIVSGPATGVAPDPDELERVREAVPDRRLLVGSGASEHNVRSLLAVASGVIVGSALKPGQDPTVPIDAALARAFVKAARQA